VAGGPARPPRPRETSEERQRRAEERALEKQRRELEALERDARTVFAYNLSTKADERDVFQFFGRAGVVSDVRIIYDRNTPRSKGMAYVEFADKESITAALEA
jgi:RNA-binding protein 39